MKTMFWSCLYVTIGSVSLFLVTWFLTGIYSFDRKAFAQTEGGASPPGVVTNPGVVPLPSSPPPPNPNPSEVVTNPGVVPPPPPPNPNPSGVVTNPGVVPPPSSPPPNPNPSGVVTNPGVVPPSSLPPPPVNPEVVTNPGVVPPPVVPNSEAVANSGEASSPAIPEEGIPATEFTVSPAPVKLPRPTIPKNVSNPTLESTQKNLDDIDKKIAEVYRMLRNYQYDSSDRRNPFSPPIEFKNKKAETNIPSYPTGKYKLNEIKLIGIKWGGKLDTGKALFQTPDNVVHTLQKNDRIGISRGIVYQLREDEVIVLQPKMIASQDEDLFIPIVIRMDRWDPKKL